MRLSARRQADATPPVALSTRSDHAHLKDIANTAFPAYAFLHVARMDDTREWTTDAMARVVHRPTSSGWTTAAVASTSTPPSRAIHREWHGQEGQDRIVATLMLGSSKPLYFIDLASSGGQMHSNTLALERDLGWRGLCIEANSRFWPSLVTKRTCKVVGAAVAEMRAELGFHTPVIQGMGGLVGPGMKNARANASMRVQAVPLAEVFREFRVPPAIQHGQTALARTCGHPPPQRPVCWLRAALLAQEKRLQRLDPAGEMLRRRSDGCPQPPSSPAFWPSQAIAYLSLDVEGAESLVMRTFPFATHTVSILSVESPKADLAALLRSHGYRYHCSSIGQSVIFGLRNNDQLWLHETAETLVPAQAWALRADPLRSGRTTCTKCGAQFRYASAPLARCDVLYAHAPFAMSQWRNASRP